MGPLSYDEMHDALEDMIDELPDEIFRELNGGVSLLTDLKEHSQSASPQLFICGEYHNEPFGLGRYITIYYGSLLRLYGHLNREKQLGELRRVLHHELTHHIESLAGDRSLEVQDEIDLMKYKSRRKESVLLKYKRGENDPGAARSD